MEEPSYRLVSEAELDAGIAHAYSKYIEGVIDREKLRRIVNTIRRRVRTEGRDKYVFFLRCALAAEKIFNDDLREMYKAAIAKISAAHRAESKKKYSKNKQAPKQRPQEPEVAESEASAAPAAKPRRTRRRRRREIVISDLGPLRREEIRQEAEMWGLGSKYIPMRQ